MAKKQGCAKKLWERKERESKPEPGLPSGQRGQQAFGRELSGRSAPRAGKRCRGVE